MLAFAAPVGGCGQATSPPGNGDSGHEPDDQPMNTDGGATNGPGGSSSIEYPGTIGGAAIKRNGELFTLETERLAMQVDANVGARIVSFTVDGIETLVAEGAAAQYGATFWPSPQTWDWPPTASIPEIDSAPYEAQVENGVLVLLSQPTSEGLVVQKSFSGATDGSIAVVYELQNTGDSSLSVAPWEITRFAGGITVYPTGPAGQLAESSLMVEEIGDHTWYEYDATTLSGVPKSSGDGAAGWIAHTLSGQQTGSSAVLVLKRFMDLAQADFAPMHGEVEIYADPSGSYMEVEAQGAYRTLSEGEDLSWKLVWDGAVVGEDVTLETGSQQLIEIATSL